MVGCICAEKDKGDKHGLAIRGPEVNRFIRIAGGDQGLAELERPGKARVGHRDPTADACRREPLALIKMPGQVFRESKLLMQTPPDRLEEGLPAFGTQPGVHSPKAQGADEVGLSTADGFPVLFNVEVLGASPSQQGVPTEDVFAVLQGAGDLPEPNPTLDGGLGHSEKLYHFWYF